MLRNREKLPDAVLYSTEGEEISPIQLDSAAGRFFPTSAALHCLVLLIFFSLLIDASIWPRRGDQQHILSHPRRLVRYAKLLLRILRCAPSTIVERRRGHAISVRRAAAYRNCRWREIWSLKFLRPTRPGPTRLFLSSLSRRKFSTSVSSHA